MSKTFTKADIINHLNESIGINKTEAKLLVESLFKEILVTLSNKQSVKISGFGNFDILDKKERIGRNPKTGEIAIISARKVVTFRAGKKLRESIQIKDD